MEKSFIGCRVYAILAIELLLPEYDDSTGKIIMFLSRGIAEFLPSLWGKYISFYVSLTLAGDLSLVFPWCPTFTDYLSLVFPWWPTSGRIPVSICNTKQKKNHFLINQFPIDQKFYKKKQWGDSMDNYLSLSFKIINLVFLPYTYDLLKHFSWRFK